MNTKYVSLTMDRPTIHFWPKMGFLRYHDQPNLPANVTAFNRTGIEIISRCDGTRKLNDLAEELSAVYDTQYGEVLEQIRQFFESVQNAGIIKLTEKRMPIEIRTTGNREYAIPIHCAVEITHNCNLRCRHCYISSDFESGTQMCIKDILRLFEILEEWGVASIELTGGEPLAHPQFEQIIQSASNKFDLIGIITNGTLMTSNILEIMSYDPSKYVIQIDLDGVEPCYVNWFRGRSGVFEQALNAIRSVVRHGIILRVAMIVTPINLDQVEKTAALARELGADSFGVTPVIPQGRGRDQRLLMSVEEWKEFMKIWNSLRSNYDDFIFQLRESQFQVTQGNCGAGSRTVAITPNGDVKLCQMSSPSQFCFGNAFKNNCEELFRSTVERIASIEPPDQGMCEGCEHFGFCYNCIHRGIVKGRAIECPWYLKYKDSLEMETAHDKLHD